MSLRNPTTAGGGKVWSIYVAAGVLLGMVCQEGRAYDEWTHQLIVDYSAVLYDALRPGREPFAALPLLELGARHEDAYDHVFGHGWPQETGTHFWAPDAGPGQRFVLPPSPTVFENAYQKATGYGLTNWALWQQATTCYALGDKVTAYERLGHICHLIGDMSVPAHVHCAPHLVEDHYESFMEDNATWVLSGMDQRELAKGLVPIPQGGPDEVLFHLMYSTAQRADFFASIGDALFTGNAIDPLGVVDYTGFLPMLYYWNHVDTPVWCCTNANCWQVVPDVTGQTCPWCGSLGLVADPTAIIAQRYTAVYSVRATATLLDYWDRTGVPEPGCLAMLCLAAAPLACRRRPSCHGEPRTGFR